MTQPAPRSAMVLAAGLGQRLRPLTENLPKPLVVVAGHTLIDRALDHLAAAGVENVVVNLHYLGHMIETHLAERAKPRITFSRETDRLLETGGGVAMALPLLGDDPFFVVNADIAWADRAAPALRRLTGFWREDEMDALLLLHPVSAATGFDGAGDYGIDEAIDGSDIAARALRHRGDRLSAPYVFTGVQLLHPRLFADAPDGPFSLVRLYHAAEAAGRLFGIVHHGKWHHIGTLEGLDVARQHLAGQPAGGG